MFTHMRQFRSLVVTVNKKLSKLYFNKENSETEEKDSKRRCVKMKSTHGLFFTKTSGWFSVA